MEEQKKEEQNKEEQNKEELNSDLIKKLHDRLDKMAVAIERTNIADYVQFIKSPWKMVLFQLAGGIARGFGLAIGMTLIAAFLIVVLTRILAHLITLPFVGQQIAQLVEMVNQYLKEGQRLNLQ